MRWLATALLLLLLISCGRHDPPTADQPPAPLPQSHYVWQRIWGPPVATAVTRMADRSAAWYILAGEFSIDQQAKLRVQRFTPDWAALAQTDRPVHLVFRADLAVVKSFPHQTARTILIDHLTSAWETLAADAATHGLTLTGIQLDCDIPTARLPDYQTLLAELRPTLPKGAQLSITSLPTWQSSKALTPLLDHVDFHVLQVHALERPQTIDDHPKLFYPDRLAAYCQRAAAASDTPYLIALPTYAYRLTFDADGTFLSLAGEGATNPQKTDNKHFLLLSDPDEIATTVRQLTAAPPPGCSGIIWFRLPVDTDQLNWSWYALRAVMDGNAPLRRMSAECRPAAPHLYDLWITNTGERNLPGAHVQITLTLGDNTITAQDVVGTSQLLDSTAPGTIHIKATAPVLDHPRRVAWFRLATDHPPDVAIQLLP